MNKLIMMIALCGIATQVGAAGSETRNGPSPARLKAYHERIAREGGFVVKPAVGKKVLFVNAQDMVDEKAVSDAVTLISSKTRLLVETIKGEAGKAYRPNETVGATITIIAKAGEPTLLIAPENAWAVVNVEPLKSDNPDKNTLETRVVKEIWRGFAMVMGASNSPYQPCIMHQVNKPKDLDVNPMVTPSPMLYNSIREASQSLGIGEFVRESYLSACKHGWAPAPTNDVQKAIWEKAHELPANPLPLTKPAK